MAPRIILIADITVKEVENALGIYILNKGGCIIGSFIAIINSRNLYIAVIVILINNSMKIKILIDSIEDHSIIACFE